ncbi:AT-hook motif nuclear-localized protein 11-like [Andrographis paniculata]|uniref:AT-hook motif nuclear-localized protein 11-like n=1 Tax=Andrographis paniculata TaxID=175694 RepID=UPI0021E7C844|nr:AT-hook motif nuclear-localized protein 11-like [Andrographis paniculata]XP_051122806.1 AT-hook motif nuclear-localized protein 11-like [Andrographis paniculata]XP_051122813.1 AT-hook motif nuclear-localized protein 11-like [Andrographis paniculata]XP_051122824.1 AT-hook motif nuclear-localized protein 11-like [Andrographis paniculata]
MDQRDPMSLTGSASYYVHQGQAESVTGLQSSPNMSPLSNPAVHFQSNTGAGLAVPTLPLDSSSTMSPHGVNLGPPSALQPGEPVRRKRGRPRKYGHDGSVSLALSPSMSNPASAMRPAQKWRGRPPGSGRKQQLSSIGASMFNGAGTMTPHIINVAVGEDIKRRILSLLQGHRVIVILSGIGSISSASIKISSSNGRSVTYEGHFDMVNLSGSYINDVGGPHGTTGGINVTFAGPDGRLIGGPVEGVLIAASQVQVIVGTLVPSSSKSKNKMIEDPEASGDHDRSTVGNAVTSANIQPSQNINPMSAWQSSR